eukprot:3365153-Rhodomonas_salina.2
MFLQFVNPGSLPRSVNAGILVVVVESEGDELLYKSEPDEPIRSPFVCDGGCEAADCAIGAAICDAPLLALCDCEEMLVQGEASKL